MPPDGARWVIDRFNAYEMTSRLLGGSDSNFLAYSDRNEQPEWLIYTRPTRSKRGTDPMDLMRFFPKFQDYVSAIAHSLEAIAHWLRKTNV